MSEEFLCVDGASIFYKSSEAREDELLSFIENIEDRNLNDEETYKEFEKTFAAKNASFMCDASYLPTHKPAEIILHQSLYSPYKRMHLTKFHLYVSTRGFILKVSGPWASDGRHNDARLLKYDAKHDHHFRQFLMDLETKPATLYADRG